MTQKCPGKGEVLCASDAAWSNCTDSAADGRYGGPLCAVCLQTDGMQQQQDSDLLCSLCDSASAAKSVLLLVALLAVVALVLLLRRAFARAYKHYRAANEFMDELWTTANIVAGEDLTAGSSANDILQDNLLLLAEGKTAETDTAADDSRTSTDAAAKAAAAAEAEAKRQQEGELKRKAIRKKRAQKRHRGELVATWPRGRGSSDWARTHRRRGDQ